MAEFDGMTAVDAGFCADDDKGFVTGIDGDGAETCCEDGRAADWTVTLLTLAAVVTTVDWTIGLTGLSTCGIAAADGSSNSFWPEPLPLSNANSASD